MNKEYNLTLITPPVIEPLSLDEVKNYLRTDDIADTQEDAYISSLITVAREWCEDYQHRAYITQTWELALQEFPFDNTDTLNDNEESDIIEIPKGNLQSINSITYKDLYGNVKSLAENTDYIVSTRGIIGKICPPYACVFPTVPLWPLDPIVINFTCGYGDDSSKIPKRIKQAMLLLISHWYDTRAVITDLRSVDVTKEIGFTVSALLSVDKIYKL
ncbi:head-tail connector protein [Clostridium sp. Mt-5]|uniref:Head-tail connector protein n=1 Tax=Clostridium moutaii TaxID=3240932 RepID=A0ABV4BV39_9CLOT